MNYFNLDNQRKIWIYIPSLNLWCSSSVHLPVTLPCCCAAVKHFLLRRAFRVDISCPWVREAPLVPEACILSARLPRIFVVPCIWCRGLLSNELSYEPSYLENVDLFLGLDWAANYDAGWLSSSSALMYTSLVYSWGCSADSLSDASPASGSLCPSVRLKASVLFLDATAAGVCIGAGFMISAVYWWFGVRLSLIWRKRNVWVSGKSKDYLL